MRALIAVAALLVAAPALAQQAPAATSAVLADATQAPARVVIIDGASWRCDDTACTATGGSAQPAPRACRRVAQRLGQVTAFTWKGVALDEQQLAACNAAA